MTKCPKVCDEAKQNETIRYDTIRYDTISTHHRRNMGHFVSFLASLLILLPVIGRYRSFRFVSLHHRHSGTLSCAR